MRSALRRVVAAVFLAPWCGPSEAHAAFRGAGRSGAPKDGRRAGPGGPVGRARGAVRAGGRAGAPAAQPPRPLLDARQLGSGGGELAEAYPGVDFAVPRTMGEALGRFASAPTPRFIALAAAAPAALRLGLLPPVQPCPHPLQPFGWVDVAVALAVAAFWVFQEWFIHDALLHSEVEWPGRSIHEGHHQLPYYHVSLDELPIAVAWFAAAAVALLALLGPLGFGPALTALASYSAMGGLYELSHFLSHTRVPLQGHWARVRAHHQRHHLRNDGYWLGFTLPAVDGLLGTDPAPASVPFRAPGDASPRRSDR